MQLTAWNFSLCGETGCTVEWHRFRLPTVGRRLSNFLIRRCSVYYRASIADVRPRAIGSPRLFERDTRSSKRFCHHTLAWTGHRAMVPSTISLSRSSSPTESSSIPCPHPAMFPLPHPSRSSQRRRIHKPRRCDVIRINASTHRVASA